MGKVNIRFVITRNRPKSLFKNVLFMLPTKRILENEESIGTEKEQNVTQKMKTVYFHFRKSIDFFNIIKKNFTNS